MNLLYLVHRTPYPPNKGDRIRAFHLLRYLAQHATVHLASLADKPVDDETVSALQRFCKRLAIVPLSKWTRWPRALGSLLGGGTVTEGAFSSAALRRLVRDWCRDTTFDAALASASSMAGYLRMDELRGVPAVVDLVDVDSQKWLDYAALHCGPKAWLYRTEGRRLRRLEQAIGAWARAVTLVSDAEADLCRRSCAGAPVHAVTNGVDTERFLPEPQADEQGCVFVGALDYFPNVDGVGWFGREVWPELHRQRPGARFQIVGLQPAPAVRDLAVVPGVEVVGPVPDVRPHLARAAVVLVPLRIARGVQNKVLEAMAMGKAVVASPESLKGLRARAGVHVLAASSPQQWRDAVLRLLDDVGLRRQLGVAARRYVEEQHSWDRCLEPFRGLLGLAPADSGARPILAAAGRNPR